MSREERITVAEYCPVPHVQYRLLSKFPDKQEVYLDVIVERPKKLIERNLLGVERPACRFAAGALKYSDFKCLP